MLLEVGGVGYLVRVPLSALPAIQTSSGITSLFIHTAVREDAIDLYGFISQEELSFFKQLMSVSGIGPKSALNILNLTDVHTLKRGIAQGDAGSLTKVFGIGKKSAERIVVELRDKITLEVAARPAGAAHAGDDMEVIEALMALGYSATEARRALKEAHKSGMVGAGVRLQERLSAALKTLGTPSA